jgi:hypothetical protein
MNHQTVPSKGIVLRKNKYGQLQICLHPETLTEYLKTFVPNKNGWIEHLAEEKDNPQPNTPSHRLIPTTPQRTIKPDFAPENKNAA